MTLEIEPPAIARLLVLCSGEAWMEVARRSAIVLGIGALERLQSVEQAILRLSTSACRSICLLLQPELADGLSAELLALTVDAADQEACLLVLTVGHPAWPVPAAGRPEVDRLVAAIDVARWARPRPPVELSGREVRAALRDDRVRARYQPMVRLSDGHPIAVEALARLRHPDGGTVAANLFVPAIEDAGLAPELTEAIAARAFEDPTILATDLIISINLSLDVLLIPAAVDRLDERRGNAGIDSGRCVVELTESRPVDDLPALATAIGRLRQMGYGVAIDDVGPAVAHHRSLFDLPFTSLKLAFEIVRLSVSSTAARDFLAQTIDLGLSRGLDVVAEGIETQQIWTSMQALGAVHGQGFMIARPLLASAVPIWRKGWCAQVADQTAR